MEGKKRASKLHFPSCGEESESPTGTGKARKRKAGTKEEARAACGVTSKAV